MSSTPAEKPGVTKSSREKVLLAVLLVLLGFAYHPLFTWETTADIVPDVVSAFCSPSGVSTQFLYVLVIGLLLIRRDDIAVAYRCQGEAWSAQFYVVPGGRALADKRLCTFLRDMRGAVRDGRGAPARLSSWARRDHFFDIALHWQKFETFPRKAVAEFGYGGP